MSNIQKCETCGISGCSSCDSWPSGDECFDCWNSRMKSQKPALALTDRECPVCRLTWMHNKDINCPRCGASPVEEPKLRVYICAIHFASSVKSCTVYGTDMRAALKALRRKLKDESFEPVEITIELTDLERQL